MLSLTSAAYNPYAHLCQLVSRQYLSSGSIYHPWYMFVFGSGNKYMRLDVSQSDGNHTSQKVH